MEGIAIPLEGGASVQSPFPTYSHVGRHNLGRNGSLYLVGTLMGLLNGVDMGSPIPRSVMGIVILTLGLQVACGGTAEATKPPGSDR
jgi:hypothetical protein